MNVTKGEKMVGGGGWNLGQALSAGWGGRRDGGFQREEAEEESDSSFLLWGSRFDLYSSFGRCLQTAELHQAFIFQRSWGSRAGNILTFMSTRTWAGTKTNNSTGCQSSSAFFFFSLSKQFCVTVNVAKNKNTPLLLHLCSSAGVWQTDSFL